MPTKTVDPSVVNAFLSNQTISPLNGDGTVNPYNPITVSWDWTLGTLKNGDEVDFNVDTSLLTIANNVLVNLTTSDGTNVGTFSVDTAGNASVIFNNPNNYLASHTDIHGSLSLTTSASDEVKNNPGKSFNYVTTVGTTPFITSPDATGTVPDSNYLLKFATKDGDVWVAPNGNQYETDATTGKIHWHTDINTALDNLTGVSLIDSPESTQKIDFSTLIVTKFDSDGVAQIVDPSEYTLVQNSDGGFTLTLNDISAHYGVDYMSDMVDVNDNGKYDDDSQITNTVTLTGSHPVTGQVDSYLNTSASGNINGSTPTTPTAPATTPTVPTAPATVSKPQKGIALASETERKTQNLPQTGEESDGSTALSILGIFSGLLGALGIARRKH